VQNQPVVSVAAERLRYQLLELGFDLFRGFSRRQPRSVAHAEDMSVDSECLFAKRGVEHDICGLAADAGKLLQLSAGARDFTAIFFDQRLAEQDDVFRLGIEQPNGLDRLTQALLAEIDHLLRCSDSREQGAARDVDADVRGLCGQYDSDKQLIGIAGF
jgi:hypothetical protein